ncbi:hypothetical protein [Desulfobacula phenolica]|uniref:Uncharacterized protein n=1 Tax=Desulfobacula phenolica TaxID=90732 RepID=A0A1H2I304_9BACT|nr:hypothetical protein [Desulfobacula phenolica]SDU38511.1 hypothetical protein SAMN04487931_107205 [Desulfobacula phenolica]
MSVYVISSCFLENLNSKIYLTEVLLKFPEQNSLRVGIDKDKFIIDLYGKIAEDRPEIASWLCIMSYEPSAFEEITTIGDSLSEEKEIFLYVCKSVAGSKQMIVHTIQDFNGYNIMENNKIEYSGETIRILEKDDAVGEFKIDRKTTIIKNSTVATGGSIIEGIKK